MASWIPDGSNGFTVNGNIVTRVNSREIGNSIWKHGKGETSGKHYWKIHFQTLKDGGGVGLTSKDHFRKGLDCKSILYLGNLSNGETLLVGSFGPSLTAGDVIGILAVFEDGRLKMYIDVNEKSLGLVFDVPGSTFKSIFPVVSFNTSGSATCTKQKEIPNITDRDPKTFGIEGRWNIINYQVGPVTMKLKEYLPSCIIEREKTNLYTWRVNVVNHLFTTLKREDGNWITSGIVSTLMGSTTELMALEFSVRSLMKNVKYVEIEANGELCIKSEKISSKWLRLDSIPQPFIGEPF